MREIITEHGWPLVSLVGTEGAKNAWLLVQHADSDVALQKKCLRLMETHFKTDRTEINPMHIAFLTDRIQVNMKKPQKFGTQFYTNKKGDFTYWPIRDIKNVNKRRAEFNIEPLEEYIEAAKSFAPVPIRKTLQ